MGTNPCRNSAFSMGVIQVPIASIAVQTRDRDPSMTMTVLLAVVTLTSNENWYVQTRETITGRADT